MHFQNNDNKEALFKCGNKVSTQIRLQNFFFFFFFFNFFFFSFYHNKIHPVTNYKAIKNKINKTRQHKTIFFKQTKQQQQQQKKTTKKQ